MSWSCFMLHVSSGLTCWFHMCQVKVCCVYAKTSTNGSCPVSVLGCGHCKKAKPEFMDAAQHDADNNKVRKLSLFLFGFSIHVLES